MRRFPILASITVAAALTSCRLFHKAQGAANELPKVLEALSKEVGTYGTLVNIVNGNYMQVSVFNSPWNGEKSCCDIEGLRRVSRAKVHTASMATSVGYQSSRHPSGYARWTYTCLV